MTWMWCHTNSKHIIGCNVHDESNQNTQMATSSKYTGILFTATKYLYAFL